MKLSAVLVAMLSLAGIGRAGQTNQVELHQPGPASQPPATGLSAPPVSGTNAAQRLLRIESKYGGVLPEVGRRKGQFFRPTPSRPASPPRGFENVSINPITGRADGIILLSIKF